MTSVRSHVLRPAPPFDFAQTLRFLGGFAPTQGEQLLEEGTLSKAVRMSGRTFGFRVRATGTPDAPELACEVSAGQPPSLAEEWAVLGRVGFFLSLDDDLRPFYQLAQDDPPFRPVLRQLYGYHQLKFPTPFENACWAVLTQRTPLDVARTMKRRLVEEYGGSVEVAGAKLWAFPEPAGLRDVPADELGARLGNRRKGEYLAAVAGAFGSVDELWLRSAPYQEVKAWLLGIHGVGEWSATFVLLRGLGRREGPLLDDPDGPLGQEMLRAASKVYGPMSFEDLRAVARHYGDWQGYWGHYLRAAG